jgi:hypothetical protein
MEIFHKLKLTLGMSVCIRSMEYMIVVMAMTMYIMIMGFITLVMNISTGNKCKISRMNCLRILFLISTNFLMSFDDHAKNYVSGDHRRYEVN